MSAMCVSIVQTEGMSRAVVSRFAGLLKVCGRTGRTTMAANIEARRGAIFTGNIARATAALANRVSDQRDRSLRWKRLATQ